VPPKIPIKIIKDEKFKIKKKIKIFCFEYKKAKINVVNKIAEKIL
jgi:hypothetical protein